MTRSFSLSLFLTALLALSLPVFAFGQEMESPSSSATTEVAQTVRLENAVLLGQERGSFSVSFTLQNLESRELSDIQYEVTLVDKESSILQFLGTEVVTLEANETIEKVITYPIRDIPLGEYLVSVGAKITGSEQMAQVIIGTLQMTEALAVTSGAENVAPATETAVASEVVPVSKAAMRQNLHLIITLLAFAITFLVIFLAVTRQKKAPVNV